MIFKGRSIKFILIGGLVLLIALLYGSCSTSTYIGRWLKWRGSDILDYEKFPSYEFHASNVPFFFSVDTNRNLKTFMVPKNSREEVALDKLLANTGTTAFLVISKDTIFMESYYNGYERSSMNTSFSVAKSVTSLMVGVALEQGLITSAADPVTKYLPQLAKTDQRYTEVTVANLLDMRSGIEFADHDLPWGDKPKAYYYPRLRERILQLKVTDQPGGAFKYNSYNPIVLGMILENVALKSPARYFEEMIWNKLGMEFSGSWSTDSESSMMTKMESGINLRAIDFAKLGRLMLFRGNWNGRQIISTEWVDQCTTIDLAHQLTEFGPEIYYENFWWLFSRDQQKPFIVSGWGHLGQFLYIFPAEQVIIVRMGKRTGDVDSWSKVFTAIVAHLEP